MANKTKEYKSFNDFTNLYEVQKTLRFELKPVGNTLNNMRQCLRYDKDLQTFLADQEIEDAYQILKPFLDSLHEEFITDGLVSETAQNVDFLEYLANYKDKKDLKKAEDTLRKRFSEAFQKAGEKWKEKYSKYKWKKGSKIASGADVLSSQDILHLIKDTHQDDTQIKKIVDETFKGLFTYFGGFNQNRANYYETSKEAATAIATRIVHENLPKFCDNLIQFECIARKKKDGTIERIERKFEYLNAYKYLKDHNKTTQIKDAKSGEMIEASVISENIFKIIHFSSCLSQGGIEKYNRIIGYYNLLINLYNQAKRLEEKHLNKKEKTFKDLPKFKTLWKQIGCGKKDPLFFSLTHNTKIQAEKNKEKRKKPYSVEQILEQAKSAGEKYFQGKSDDGIVNTVPEFLEYILGKENYDGVYWSKAAMNTISNKYFANYHDLKDRLKETKVFQKAVKGSDEDIKIPEAIELSGLFDVLDATADWKTSIFLNRILEDEEKAKIIQESQVPSEALLKMIFSDIKENAKQFLDSASTALSLKEYKSKESIEIIKQWLDYALAVNQMLKYFLVKESKVKGAPIDPVITEALNVFLRADDAEWFKWYDALRNYLTKKPQDDAKNNKLKLNFKNASLLDGWDVNKEASNLCVVLQNTNGNQLLAVLNKENNNLFQEKMEGRGKNKTSIENSLYLVARQEEALEKMEYDFWADVSKMIPKCSTQLKQVIKHFQNSNDDFIFPAGYKVTSGEKFTEECRITKKEFELNNKVFKKDDVSINAMRYDLSDTQEKQYIKLFQKEFWEILLKQAKNDTNLPKKDIFIEWKIFCGKQYSELLEWEKKYKDALTDWINFCKYFLLKYPKTTLFDYKFKQTEKYNSLDEFYLDVDICSYKLKINKKINKTILDKFVQEGKVYLFEIKNQDLNDGKKDDHKNNLHTIYWQAIFKDMKNRPKLNGKAEIFYRKAIPFEKLEKVKGRKGKDGEDVIKNFRFSKEKFLFHVPITLNFCLKNEKINDIVNEIISQNSDTYFLGIDRGEKHLAYYSLINQKGEIKKQDTLNMPFIDKDKKPRSIKKDKYFYNAQEKRWEAKEVECWNYNDLLDAMASNRDMARKNWQTIGTIKELKNGYVSQVIRKIVDIAVNKNRGTPSFIVLENLNVGFKRGRQKIEKQVYQKLELALAKKLNFLVDKNAENGEIGSVTSALQLTPPVNNFGDIENKKQFGIMLYTKADYTSQTDPITGWRKSIYLKKGSEEYIKKQIIDIFDDIGFDGQDFYFDYTVDYLDPKNKKSDKKFQKQWRLYSSKNGVNLDRFRGERNNDKNQWISKSQDIFEILNGVFKDFDFKSSLLAQIKEGANPKKIDSKYTGWESLRFAIDIIQQIRNNGTEKRDEDFILSPVRDENGNNFDSRNAKENQPSSGDANGAYNIARKGIIMNEHIKIDLSLFIRDEEWDAWLAGEEVWNTWIRKNEKDLYRAKK